MSCRCLGINATFEHVKKVAQAYFKETGEVCIVYEYKPNYFTWVLKTAMPLGIKIAYETV
jgi:hypothetical protein